MVATCSKLSVRNALISLSPPLEAPEVTAVAERFGATPFDIEDVFWSHRGERCTFDVMVAEFGLSMPPLERLATMVRAADAARLDLSPEAPGLLAASQGRLTDLRQRPRDRTFPRAGAGAALWLAR